MKSQYTSIEGAQELIDAFKHSNALIDREGRKLLRTLSVFAVKQAQIEILNVGAVDTNELIQGIQYELSSSALESTVKPSKTADKYAAAVEYGTKPHRPPASALQGWADRHGIPVWAVVKKIEREGTEPRHFWQRTYEIVDEKVDSELPDFLDILVRGL